jgi:hypothetical protein
MKKHLAPYEKAGKLIKLMGWLCCAFAFIITIFVLAPLSVHEGEVIKVVYFPVMILAMGIAFLFVGKAVLDHKNWGRIGGIILGVLSLLYFPIGTILGAIVLWYLSKPWDEQAQSASVEVTTFPSHGSKVCKIKNVEKKIQSYSSGIGWLVAIYITIGVGIVLYHVSEDFNKDKGYALLMCICLVAMGIFFKDVFKNWLHRLYEQDVAKCKLALRGILLFHALTICLIVGFIAFKLRI